MSDEAGGVYPPLNTMKRVAPDVWIVDGPIIRFGVRWAKAPFPTRMTIVRLRENRLFVHSPTPLTDSLRAEVEAAGEVAWIVGPNRLHYWWIPDWRTAFPKAQVYLAPGVEKQARDRIDFAHRALDQERGYPWDDEISTLPVGRGYFTEIVFFHYRSATLILTDLIENFERSKLGSIFMRWLTRLGGVQDPDGQTPRDMRLALSRGRGEVRAAVERMIGWAPQRIILAHGRWYEKDGVKELRRAFRWALR